MSQKIISFEPLGGDLYNVVYTRDISVINPKMQIEQLEKLFDKEPFNFEVAFELSKRYADSGMHEKACEVRFRAANEAIEALPEEDEYMELDWNEDENQEFIEIIAASGIDFYVHGDFEMAAALLETALMLDSEDHLNITPQLTLSYLAIEDWDGYEQLKNDFADRSMIEALVENFAAFRLNRKSETQMPQELILELTSDEHEIDDEFFKALEANRVSKNFTARELWYRHMTIFETFPQFIDQYRN